MARLRNVSSGAVVSVSDEKATRLGSEWEAVSDEPAKADAPAKKKATARRRSQA